MGIGLTAACPAEAIGPRGGIIANGTSFNGLALQGLTLNNIRMQEPEEDDEVWNCQSDGICPKNGTQLNGITLESMTLEGIELKATAVVLDH